MAIALIIRGLNHDCHTKERINEILCVTIQPEEIVFTITRVTLVSSDNKVHVYRACVGLRYRFTSHAWD